MKVNNWLVFFLVLVGVAVGSMSLYTASLSGVMGKMGLVGGDFGQSIKTNQLARQLMNIPHEEDCRILTVARNIPEYLLSKGEKKIQLAGKLGGERIVCGVMHIQDGNIERGVYTIVKGLYYLKNYYFEMRVIIEADTKKCNLLVEPGYERWVESYLNSTEGRIHEVVLDVYKQVEGERARVEELCLD